MKAISLTQPFASLVAAGLKHVETRSWTTAYRGPLAIHASKAFPKWARELCHTEPFTALLGTLVGDLTQLPLGALVAVTRLVDVQPMTFHNLIEEQAFSWITPDREQRTYWLDYRERAFGDYQIGRFAWLLADTRALVQPVTGVKGSLGLWECESIFLPKGL